MTEGESGGKLVNKFVKEEQETVMEEEGADEDLCGQNVPGFYSSCCIFLLI